MSGTSIAPGFMVVHGNHPEALRNLMVAWMARHPLLPLEDEWVLVQSNGVAQWLKLSLAADAEQGGAGISAALQTALPASFIWQAYRSVLGAASVPGTSPFDKSLLVWRLIRLLPGLLEEEVFAPLRQFLADDADMRKLHQLAARLSDLIDQYQVYRADWLAAWERNEDVIVTSRGASEAVPEDLKWQPRLWRALREDVGEVGAGASRAAVHLRFLAAAPQWQGERPVGLPRRLTVFGISSLPQQALEVLATLSKWVQVLMCVHNPCEHDWSHIVPDKDLLLAQRRRHARRAGTAQEIPDEALHLHSHPLLAAWGKQGRDFIRLLDTHDEHERYARHFASIGHRIDSFAPNARDSLLRQLQDDVLDLRPLNESRVHWPALDPAAERSIRFHIAHGALREVEVLHDQILAAFAADTSLRPRDIIVMVPDVTTYAPLVQAVFGLISPEDPRYVPFTVSDQGQRHHDPLLGALEKLLALPNLRLSMSDVLDLLEVPAVRARFGIADSDMPQLHRWISASNVRWGLHAAQRESLDLPGAFEMNTWDFGLQRMLLGYAVGAGDAWAGIEPLDEIGGLESALLGPLATLISRLEAHWRVLASEGTPAEWAARLGSLLADFFQADQDHDGFTITRLESALLDWLDACRAAGLVGALPLSVVREDWLERIDRPALNRPFFAGAVTFATLMPMRAIPFRMVALLGMNDGDYPRSRMAMDFDLMGCDYRPGDRSRREDDRYLFLEALLSARDRLHISWIGRSIHDQSERPPSVLVAQLRDHLAAGWKLQGEDAADPKNQGQRLLRALTVTHRLQAFHPAYFTEAGDPRLFSYAREWRTPSATPPLTTELGPKSLSPFEFEGPLTLRTLGEFLKEPAKSFFQLRLGVHFDDAVSLADDQEPFAFDALENWKLQDELVAAQKAALARGDSRSEALEKQLSRMARRGTLPPGRFADLAQEQLQEPMDAMFTDYAEKLGAWPDSLPDEAVDWLPEGLGEPLRLVDWLDSLRANAAGERCRLMLDSGSFITAGRYRREKLVTYWVAHLAGHLAGKPLTSIIVNKTGSVTLLPLPALQAKVAWDQLLTAWQQGMRQPLPLALESAFAWMDRYDKGDDAADALALQAARVRYEENDPQYFVFGERAKSAYLERAFPDFSALWCDGEFAEWADALLRPLDNAIARAAGPKTGAAKAPQKEKV